MSFEEATEKQIKFATSLGIDNPSQFTKQALKELIDQKVQAKNRGKPKQELSTGQIASTQGVSEVHHTFQSSYEFGPAGNRHSIKYFTITELKSKMDELRNAGMLEDEFPVEKV